VTGQDHATCTYIELLDAVHQWGETEQALGFAQTTKASKQTEKQ